MPSATRPAVYPTDNQGEGGKSLGEVSGPIRLAGSTLSNRAHICAFFNSLEDAHRVLLPFIKEGLERGEKAVHTIDPRRRDEHTRLLASAGIDVAAAHKNDQLEVRDWTDTHLRGGHFDQHRTLALFEKVVLDAKEQAFRGGNNATKSGIVSWVKNCRIIEHRFASTDTKVSTDTIVQLFRLHASGVIAWLPNYRACTALSLRKFGPLSGRYVQSRRTQQVLFNDNSAIHKEDLFKGERRMEDNTLAQSSFSATINAPIEKVDIPSWCHRALRPAPHRRMIFALPRRCYGSTAPSGVAKKYSIT